VARVVGEALAAGWRVAVASTSAQPSVAATLERAVGAGQASAVKVFAGDIVPRKKPAPDIYLAALDWLGLPPAQAVGRRGVAGNFFVIKAVGAASERGADLTELLRIGNKVNDVTRTMGMALTSCTPPAKGSPLFELGADEMEMAGASLTLSRLDPEIDELLGAPAEIAIRVF
jgi:dihydroxyacetone kinase